MAHVIICDVCEKQYAKKEWDTDPGIEATIPQELMGDVGEALEATFCSWVCLSKIAAHYAREVPLEEVEGPSDTQVDPDPEPIHITPSATAMGQPFEMPQVRIKR